MATYTETVIDSLAENCVADMGDIFWDFDPDRDAEGDYSDPEQIARKSVRKALRKLAKQFDTSGIYTGSLRAEYQTIVAEVGENGSDDDITAALMANADWTKKGASEVLSLARNYGTSILRNALALAEALKIEDGEAGF